MTYKVLVANRCEFPYEDWQDVVGNEQVEICNIDADTVLGKFDLFWEVAQNVDLVIFPWEGFLIHQWFQKWKDFSEFKKFFSLDSIKKVAWSMDSHHQWPIEQQYQQYFSTYYLAHSPYIEKFEKDKAVWLPCYWALSSRKELLRLAMMNVEKTHDFSAIYRNYWDIGTRNIIAYECWKRIQETQYTSLFGQSNGQYFGKKYGERYLQAILTGRIILNFSIIDDLNVRNFEAIGLNQVMITNRVLDHQKINLDYSNTVFFERYDMKSFDKAIEEAMAIASKPKRTIDNIVNSHMQVHRYVEMFNREFGLQLAVRPINVDEFLRKEAQSEDNKQENIFVIDAEQGDQEYLQQDLAIHAANVYLNKGDFLAAYKCIHEVLEDQKIEQNDLWQKNQRDFLFVLEKCIQLFREVNDFYLQLSILLLLQFINLSIEKVASRQIIEKIIYFLAELDHWSLPGIAEMKKKIAQYSIRILESLVQEKNIQEGYLFLQKVKSIIADDGEFYYLEAQILQLAGKHYDAQKALLQYLLLTKDPSPSAKRKQAERYSVSEILKRCEFMEKEEDVPLLLQQLNYIEKLGLARKEVYKNKAMILKLLGHFPESVVYYERYIQSTSEE